MAEVPYVAAWKAIPSWFIFGTRDNSIPANLLAFMAERAGSKKTVTIERASHAVLMSHADAVVELANRLPRLEQRRLTKLTKPKQPIRQYKPITVFEKVEKISTLTTSYGLVGL